MMLLEAPLSQEQQQIADAILVQKKNVFFTGSAGTGKSRLIRYLVQKLDVVTTAITASTGIAAAALGGTTVHSFAGIGLGDGTPQDLATKAKANRMTSERIKKTKVLIVDEISMISGTLLDKVEYVIRVVRGNLAPWGGMQVVFCGDFLQLPPVKSDVFAFDAKCWSTTIHLTAQLTQVFRQSDKEFVNMLQDLRVGKCTGEVAERLAACEKTELKVIDGIKPTILDCTRADVASENTKQLEALKGDLYEFIAEDSGIPAFLPSLANLQAASTLHLKKQAQVILLSNLNVKGGLCNGTRGVVTDFIEVPSYAGKFGGVKRDGKQRDDETKQMKYVPVAKFENGILLPIEAQKWEIKSQGKVLVARRQIPLALAWSLTIHKSQGMTLLRAEVRLGRAFEAGQIYVAISRLRDLSGLKLVGFSPGSIKTSAKVVEFYRRLEESQRNREEEKSSSSSSKGIKRKRDGDDQDEEQAKDCKTE